MEGKLMDRTRFEHLLEAYGANFARWPEAERTVGEAYAHDHAVEVAPLLAEARVLDAALDAGRESASHSSSLAARILAAAPKTTPRRRASFAPAGWALAACAVLGVILGYSAGALAQSGDDGSYFAAAFEAPPDAPSPGDQG
jgi:hypothetical protein